MGSEGAPVIAVDLDEVLGQFLSQFCAWHNRTFGTEWTADEFFSYHFTDVKGGGEDEMVRKVHDFYASPDFLEHFPVIEGARETLESLKGRFRFVLVTSRQHAIEDATRSWIEKHFPGIFEQVLLGNHYGLAGEKRSKPDMCNDIGARALIDDSPKYAAECALHMPLVVLFGDYAWNRDPGQELPPNVHRVRGWAQVPALLATLLEGT